MVPYDQISDFLLRMAATQTLVHQQMALDLAEVARILAQKNFHRAAHFQDPCPECGGIMQVSFPITRETQDFCQGYRAMMECTSCGEEVMR